LFVIGAIADEVSFLPLLLAAIPGPVTQLAAVTALIITCRSTATALPSVALVAVAVATTVFVLAILAGVMRATTAGRTTALALPGALHPLLLSEQQLATAGGLLRFVLVVLFTDLETASLVGKPL
jgi:hypothetical protein